MELSQGSARQPLALVGIGCRFPGGVRDAESFWRMLLAGESGVSLVPDDRWNWRRYFHPDPAAPNRITSRRGGFVDGLKLFDAAFWGISPREARRMDPQQRWLLEAAWEALEDAGAPPERLRGADVGVYVGISTHDYSNVQSVDASSIEIASHPRKGFHGHHTATWTQDGSVHVAEGSTLEVALRRAVRQARAVSAYPSVERAASRAGERP